MLPVLLVACVSPSPVVGETLTDNGTWRLRLAETTYDQGEVDVEITATEAESGAPTAGLGILVRPGMDEMSHLLEVADCGDLGDGRYVAAVRFDMTGIWTLTGYARAGGGDTGVDTGESEGFSFVVEVRP